MVYISEFLPNPAGADADGEWVELLNAGDTPMNLAGWSLGAGSGKPRALSAQSIPPRGYVVLRRTDTKISLKNTDGEIALFDPAGRAVDRMSFRGTAAEGKSVNRADDGRGLPAVASAKVGYFAPPSPGAPNASRASLASLENHYPRGVPIAGGSGPDVAVLWVGSSALIAAAVLLVVKWNHALSELFFPRH